MWAAISWRKAFLPGLWAFLDSGAHGCAKASYPSLLPLMTLAPREARVRMLAVAFHARAAD